MTEQKLSETSIGEIDTSEKFKIMKSHYGRYYIAIKDSIYNIEYVDCLITDIHGYTLNGDVIPTEDEVNMIMNYIKPIAINGLLNVKIINQ